MRKFIAWMVSLCVLLSIAPVLGEVQAATTEGPAIVPQLVAEDMIGVQHGTTIVVGTAVPMNGYFATDMWGTNTADMDVRALLHGYETTAWSHLRSLAFNGTVVADAKVAEEETGVVYTIEIQKDLRYCDGTPITAQDYVFSLLLAGAPEVAAIGGTTQGLSHLKGYDAYQAGETKVFEGVRLLSDYAFQLHIQGAYLPKFYSLTVAAAQPYPLAVIAPGCEIRDDGAGVYIAASEQADTMDATGLSYKPGEFSVKMLQQTMADPETGYLFFPKVTSGPYALESYHAGTHTASFVINPYYKGNYEGQKPHIERLLYRYVPEEEAVDALLRGEVNLFNKASIDRVVEHAEDLVAQGEAIGMASYPRSGFAFLAFACEQSPTDSQAVRQAIAMSLDKDTLVETTMANSAMRVDGYYGMGQWMTTYQDEGNPTLGQSALSIPEALETLRKPVDIQGAKALLIADGWMLNEQGQPFKEGQDTVRYRERDGELEPLIIRWAMTEGDEVAGAIRDQLSRALPMLGISLEAHEIPFPTLLEHYYRLTERQYDMFFMASNFNYTFDPYYTFHTAQAYQGMLNTSGLQDEALMQLALAMRETAPMDLRGYTENWLLFQQRFAEQMPMVPLYSNLYYDFFSGDLQEYNPTVHPSWAAAISYAYLSLQEVKDAE